MSNLKPLVWHKDSKSWTAYGAGISYSITEFDGVATVSWHNMVKSAKDLPFSSDKKTLLSYSEALDFVEKEHYPHFMSEFFKPDSITDIRNWFKAAKPDPSIKDTCTQIGCHLEEVAEMYDAIGCDDYSNNESANTYKNADNPDAVYYYNSIEKTELLDALCDQIVTATGVAYMMGFDIEGALKEVIRSNNSKMVNGKFEFDDNGKIAKPDSYSKPDLTPFVKESDCE